ncbi:TRAP C4-dicarboxylate transport system permease DctM subunit [Leptothrix cholodnii SP-6]|uniref:TRAP C4-dicarboxylate transport system permease DctM subunit n=1 Tax=Leptothrix cholodnii (strain ATCC 51168 / LMG 8142 / SP-6) TaxID=395495 RepID=B1Y1B7_LEPCP|nr:TRAP transporter large permease subunit [Leptothrix cholodnii]ACB33094.1 TRAP C4-dicarboxylate transport system permease DctM subunit [Leptothrix cholodnii SP-6]
MSHALSSTPVDPDETAAPPPGVAAFNRALARWIAPIELVTALLMAAIVAMLFGGVVARYAFGRPITWIDEIVSFAFIWVAMLGAVLAMHRNEHLRLSMFVDRMSPRLREYVHAFALVAMATFLMGLIGPAIEHVEVEWIVETPALGIPGGLRVAAIAVGLVLMLAVVAIYSVRTVPKAALATAILGVGAFVGLCLWLSPQFMQLGLFNIVIFLTGVVALCLFAGVPIAFCFGCGVMSFLAFSSNVPLIVIVGRIDEGMANMVLVSVPIFVLLGCVLDATGMGKAIVDLLASLIGHVKAGMSYVLLGSLFIVSGISGSKVSDMATVAPALFPEMRRRGNKQPEMVALLATGAAMADTVPPSIVLIVLGSVAGVSIAGLFESGFVVAMVLLLSLLLLARWKARHEDTSSVRRPPLKAIGKLALVAAPALVLPFLIRSAVGGGIATATEVSTIAVLYAMLIGQVLYGGLGWKRVYSMLVETAALSGAILLILGTASAMAWAITQSGLVQQMSQVLTTLPGGWIAFMGVTVLVFLVLGCLLEGLPAVLLLAPIMFPIAKKLGIHEIHYSMVIVCAMNVGLMMPPIGVGFYVACRIGDAKPDDAMVAIWPYIAALLGGVIVIAMFPWFSTFML